MTTKRTKAELFQALTWEKLVAWAGEKIAKRGQSYHRNKQVTELALTADGGALAWVEGTRRYATRVDIAGRSPASRCSCPYGDTCKHAVALVLTYQERLQEGVKIPLAAEDDLRFVLLAVADESQVPHAPADLGTYLHKQTKDQLMALVQELAERFPDVATALADRQLLAEGTVQELLGAVRQDLANLSAEGHYRRGWDEYDDNDDWHASDYARLHDRLASLLAAGRADDLLALGPSLLSAGSHHLELSPESEPFDEIASCLDLLFKALPRATWPPRRKMLWAVEMELEDGYDLCRGAKTFWKQEFAPADWGALADVLIPRLAEIPVLNRYGNRNTRRESLKEWIVNALENAGREREILDLEAADAARTGNYARLVGELLDRRQFDEAEQLIRRGLAKATGDVVEVKTLRDLLRELHVRRKDWSSVAACDADAFFRHPSVQTWQSLRQSSRKANAATAVREAAWRFLETGERPTRPERGKSSAVSSTWPLPDPGIPADPHVTRMRFPEFNVLIAVALAEKDLEAGICWYDRQRREAPHLSMDGEDDQLATAIRETHPEKALAIWQALIDRELVTASTRGYHQVAIRLRALRTHLLQQKQEQVWQNYVAILRRDHARKRRLMTILDALD